MEYSSLNVRSSGVEALVEDWPGRIGYYKYGYSISGAADHLSHRIANLLVGNPPGEATIEIAGGLFEAEFEGKALISICGADLQPAINGSPAPMWESIRVGKGDVVKLSFSRGVGFRSYIAFRGGIDVPLFLGSKSTCIYGRYGGFQGRPLKQGDKLSVGASADGDFAGRRVRKENIPRMEKEWALRMMPGPTAAPDYVTVEGMERIYAHQFSIGRDANRSGYRLVTPKEIFPGSWARTGGGVAGLHPSNIVDMGYSIPGGLNVAGDQIVVLGPDGPCGGGFVVIGMVAYPDLWKLFQAIPGRDKVRFKYIGLDDLEELRVPEERKIDEVMLE